jgi:hypothetical protein
MKSNGKAHTKIVRASELEGLMWDLYRQRDPNARRRYKSALAKYDKRRGGKREVTRKKTGLLGDVQEGPVGFYELAEGEPQFVERPTFTRPVTWRYTGYDRYLGMTDHARQVGLLADPRYNREIRPSRVDEYAGEMRGGKWRDLLSDPIAITTDGQIVNGQHRIAAASQVDWTKVEHDPAFLVVLDVDPREALHADGSKRTARDEKIIAHKLMG